jgi:hypothetical protein
MAASMVAMFGWIIPAPLAIPSNVAAPTWRPATFGRVSVVMIARDAASQPCALNSAAARLRPAAILFMSRRGPITPVDITAQVRGGSPRLCSADSASACASCMPRSPVQALAIPALIASARNPAGFSARRARSYSTGAAAKRLRVKVAAAVQGRSLTSTARSAAPVLFKPQATPAKLKPRGIL